MNQIKCPNCGTIIDLDENAYNAIVTQIRNAEFERSVEKRAQEKLQVAAKEHEMQIQKLQADNAQAVSDTARTAIEEQAVLQRQIDELTTKLQQAEKIAELEKEKAVGEVRGELEQTRLQETAALKEQMREQENAYAQKLAEKEREVEFYKDYKSKLSTKMLGESLEQYCLNEFNKLRTTAFRNAYFEKDNDVVDGTKADFFYVDRTDDGVEYISIIFEMKNEGDETKTKHKNEDFFAKLDKDRRSKHAEYAVLVSTLEADSDYYNAGIVEVYNYEKMYVVRPQCFISIISLLRNAAQANVAQKRELIQLQRQNVDVTALETQLMAFKQDFSNNCRIANDHFTKAIDNIDKAIKDMLDFKESLLKSQRQYNIADRKVEEITMRKLLKDSPTLYEEYKGSKKKKDD